MHFDENAHAQAGRKRLEITHRRQIQRGGDEQYGIGAHGASFIHLIGVDKKILAQHGQCAGRTSGLQIVGRPLEVLPIREDGQTGGTMLRVACLLYTSRCV